MVATTSTTYIPAVEAGIITRYDWDYLTECVERDDLEGWCNYARDLCVRNYPLFNHLFLGYDVTPHFLKVRKMAEKFRKLLLRLPRSHSKSYEFAIGEIVHDLCYAMVPNSGYEDPRIRLVQETTTVAETTGRGIRNIIETGGPQGLIGGAFPSLAEKAVKLTDDKIWISTTGIVSKDPSFAAIGVGGAMTGSHPKKLICDDMVSKENSKTKHLRDELWTWWTNTVVGMIDPETDVKIPHTIYYADDLHMRIQASGIYKLIEIPALNRMPSMEDFEPIMSDDEETRLWVKLTSKGMDLQALWPCPLGTGNCPGTPEHMAQYGTHRSVEYLIHEKFLMDFKSFGSQFMHILLASEEQRIRPSMLRFFSFYKEDIGKPVSLFGVEDNESVVVPFPAPEEIIASVHAWDHAIGLKKKNDRTVLTRAYRTRNNDVFNIFLYGRWPFSQVVTMMEQNYYNDPIKSPSAIVTEGISFQEAYSDVVKNRAEEILPIETLKSAVDKDTALAESGMIPALMSGKWYMDIRDIEARNELLAFPAGVHDDIVDSGRIAFNKIKNAIRRQSRIVKKTGGDFYSLR